MRRPHSGISSVSINLLGRNFTKIFIVFLNFLKKELGKTHYAVGLLRNLSKFSLKFRRMVNFGLTLKIYDIINIKF